MDSGELNKLAGGAIGALLVFLLLGFVSELLYYGAGGDHGDPVLAYAVEVEQEGGGEQQEQGPDWQALLANADASNGESIFNKCQSCHAIEDGVNQVGPHLYDVVGRDIASVGAYSYSDALASKDESWGLVNLFNFLHNPSGWAPGTKMGYAGLKDDQDKVDLIAWLNQIGDSPVEFEVPAGGDGEQTAAAEGSGGEGSGGSSGDQGSSGGGSGFAQMVASADPAAGEKAFNKCKACHAVEDGVNQVGPHLYGVVGRKIASVEGYSYSDALASKDGSWDAQTLSAFLENPQGWAKGTKMSYPGVKSEEERAQLVAYLNQQSDQPVDIGGGGSGGDQASSGEGGSEGQSSEGGSGDGQQAAADGQQQGGTAESGQQSESGSGDGQQAEGGGSDEGGQQAAATGSAGGSGSGEGSDSGETSGSGEASGSGMFASADPAAGEKVFNKCKACHAVEDGKNQVGPHLYGVVGREIASVEGYSYSNALKSKDGSWDAQTLSAFLENPQGWAQGTKMAYPGLKKEAERADVIAWLNQQSDQPVELGAGGGGQSGSDQQGDDQQSDSQQNDNQQGDNQQNGNEQAQADSQQGSAGEGASSGQAQQGLAGQSQQATSDGSGGAGNQDGAQQSSGEGQQGSANGQTESGQTSGEQSSGEEASEQASGDQQAEAGGSGLQSMLASADPEAGQKVFRKCQACHAAEDGQNRVGPHLYGVVGRKIASVEGYSYSNALKSKEGEWTPDRMAAFLKNPQGWAKGTKMSYPGLTKAKDRANVIAWLNQQSDQPLDIGSGGSDVKKADARSGEAAETGQMAESDASGDVQAGASGQASAGSGNQSASDGSGAQASEGGAQQAGSDRSGQQGSADTEEQTQMAAASSEQAGGSGQTGDAAHSGVDPQNGQKIFRKCSACHSLEEGEHKVGPSLHGVVGRDIASLDRFDYSGTLAAKSGDWNREALAGYLASPTTWAPGTRMAFAGIANQKDRRDLIAYLEQAAKAGQTGDASAQTGE